jgi:hypothetical protein
VVVAGVCYSHYRAPVPRLFLKKRGNVHNRSSFMGPPSHQLDGFSTGFVANGLGYRPPVLVALRSLRMLWENSVNLAHAGKGGRGETPDLGLRQRHDALSHRLGAPISMFAMAAAQTMGWIYTTSWVEAS